MVQISLLIVASIILAVLGIFGLLSKVDNRFKLVSLLVLFSCLAGIITCFLTYIFKGEEIAGILSRWCLLGYAIIAAAFFTAFFLAKKIDAKGSPISLDEKILDLLMDGILMLNPDGYIMYANTYCQELLGVDNERLTTLRFEDLALSSEQAEGLLSLTKEKGQVSCYQDPYEIDIKLIAVLKGAIPVGVSATYLGEEAGYLLVLHDWRKKRKEEREHEQHLKETEGFLHIASHELRHPLTIMHACVPLLPRVLDNDEKREEVLGLIESGLNKMDYLVRDLLDASRLESGRFAIEKRELDLSVFLEEVAEEMRINHTDREFMMNQNGDVLFLEADSEKLRQAFVILMENAVKYTNSLVEIECKQQNGDVMISVLDRGPGIPAEEQEQIFDQFYRADKVQQGSASRGGLGLGLYIAKKIVEGHDGEIGCFSREGGGAEFRITLPRSGE